MSFKKQPLAFAPKAAPQVDSWWTRPMMQTDRVAFQRHVVAAGNGGTCESYLSD